MVQKYMWYCKCKALNFIYIFGQHELRNLSSWKVINVWDHIQNVKLEQKHFHHAAELIGGVNEE